MSDCEHLNTHSNVMVYRIPNERGDAYFTACVKIQCSTCGVLFRFCGDHSLMPDDIQDAMRRRVWAWVSPNADELGCVIAPFSANPEPLEMAGVVGRA